MKNKINIFLFAIIMTISSVFLIEYNLGEKEQATAVYDIKKEEGTIVTTNRSLEKEERMTRKLKVEYEGEALNTLEKDGKIKIYSEKDEESEIIAILDNYEKVELLETLPFGWFKVKTKDGQIGYADARYIRTRAIPPHKYDENSSAWFIKFDESNQTIYIYNEGELVLESLGSSGVWDSFTPKGIFEIEKDRRGEWAYIPRFEQGMKYWVGFKGSYLFHSVPFTEDGMVIVEEAKKLGEPSSHGCIRLPVAVAKYIYDNVPDGSIVVIE
ncbi:MAG: SH3 domain-containing protein [Sporanaerobacter sp.]|uniref:L,D-transpeptidase family protein n=1 Tax=Sporanaerobacter sp. TaxID=2010183 RepID=UPI003A101B0C